MSDFSAVLWDVDGTLVDSEPLHARSLSFALAKLGVPIPSNLREKTAGASALKIFQLMRDRYGFSINFEKWTKIRQEYYLDHAPQLDPRENAADVFHEINDLGIPQVFVSNSSRVIVRANLAAIGIELKANPDICSEDVLIGKPNPEPYLKAAELLDVPIRKCLVIEDSLTGASSAIAAGATTLLWPEYPSHTPKGAAAIQCIDEVLTWLDKSIIERGIPDEEYPRRVKLQ